MPPMMKLDRWVSPAWSRQHNLAEHALDLLLPLRLDDSC